MEVQPNIAHALVKLVAADALPLVLSHMRVGNLVKRDFAPVSAQSGDTVNVPIPTLLVHDTILQRRHCPTCGHQQPYQGLASSQIVLNRHVEASFMIPDANKVIEIPDLLRIYLLPAVLAITETIEIDLLDLYARFGANAPVGMAGAAPNDALVDAAETALFNGRVPPREQKYIVVDANAYSAWRQIPGFSEFQTSGEAGLRAIVDGTIGKVKDFFVFRSQFVPKTGSNPVNTHNLAFTKNAIGLAVRRLPRPMAGTGAITEYAEIGDFGVRVIMPYVPNTKRQTFLIDVLYGCGILRNEAGVQVNT